MSEYVISPAGWSGCFPVPSDVVDRHLKLASPDAIRVLLYLLRHGQAHPNPTVLAEALGIDEAAAVDALDYWVADGLLAPADTSASVVRTDAAVESSVPDEKSRPVAPVVVIKSGKMPSYTNIQLRDASEKFPQLRQLYLTAEDIFARPLTNADISFLYGLFDWYEFPAEVIEQILHRCHAKQKLSHVAIRDEADNFYKHGAVTREAAEAFVHDLLERETVVNETAALLRLADHTPYAKERKAFEMWRFSYGFGLDVVAVAFELALQNTGESTYSSSLLSYMNRVLSNWSRGGITTAAEAREAADRKKEPAKKESEKKEKSRSYDLNAEAELAMKRFAGKKD